MKKFLQVLLHVLGFPLLILAVVLVSLPMWKEGASYGIMVFVGLIITLVMAIIYYITFICVVKSKKKSKTKQTMILIVVIFVCLCGLWCVFDLALPDFLAGATSNTIFYEDLVDNYQARSTVNKALLDEYITRNYNAGNLPDKEHGGKTLNQYLKDGYTDQVKELLTIHFASIDGDGYASFVNPWIGMANDGRLTIPTLVHLLLDERELKEVDYYLYDKATQEIKRDKLKWNVLDMLGNDMEIAMDIEGMLKGMDIPGAELIVTALPGLVDSMLKAPLADIVEGLLGSPIYVSVNGQGITLTPSNESRAVLDYQSMAWFNSNGLLYAVVTLLSTRNLFLIFAGWLILSNFLIGVLRGMGKEHRSAKAKANLEPVNRANFQSHQQPVSNFTPMPYPYGYVVRSVGYNITPTQLGLPMANAPQTQQQQPQTGSGRRRKK